MSVIVALKDNDRFLIGCDSQATNDDTESILRTQPKIFKPEKNLVIGVTGAYRDTNILSTATEWLQKNVDVDFKYVVRYIVPKIFDELHKYKRVKNIDGIETINSNIIFAYKNKAYSIESNGCVIEINDMLADGCGYRYSMGAWSVLKDNKIMSAEDKMIQMIKASCDSNIYVGYPIVIMNTKDDEVKIIEK
jgi:ATP-dependent protease HslVU (ClpYQ) peptidase subunit